MFPQGHRGTIGFGNSLTPVGRIMLITYASIYLAELIGQHWLNLPLYEWLALSPVKSDYFHFWQLITHPMVHNPGSPIGFLINCLVLWVLYWMQQSQRAHDNPALEYAIHRANRLDLPVLVVFALTDSYPEANLRHYRFMLEGLAETQALLARRRIGMLVQKAILSRCSRNGWGNRRCWSAMWGTPAINAPGAGRCPNQPRAARWPWRVTWWCRWPSYRQKPNMPLGPSDPRSAGIWSSFWCPAPAIGRNGIGRYQNGRPGPGFHRRGLE
jgi:hypothetical protein